VCQALARLSVLLLLSGKIASAVKNIRLDIPKDQAIVVEVPPNQWAAKETSWTEGIPNFCSSSGWRFHQEPPLGKRQPSPTRRLSHR
jgi:hypothetical protein